MSTSRMTPLGERRSSRRPTATTPWPSSPTPTTAVHRVPSPSCPGPAVVPDAAGVGSTLYAAPDLPSFSPAFGPDSRAAHADLGVREVGLDAASVRRDVDTPEDLAAAEALGFGPATAAVLAAVRG